MKFFKKKSYSSTFLSVVLLTCMVIGLILPSKVRGETNTTIYNGVDYSLVYDANYYYNKYPDLQRVIGANKVALLKHFVENGMREGRQGCESFNVKYYKDKYADLQRAFGNDYVSYFKHYMNNGHKEGRVGVSYTVYNGVDYALVFDYKYYYNKYSDLQRVLGNKPEVLLNHFVNSGMKEGRQAIATFDVKYYKSRYADLQRAFGTDNVSYYKHYINNGHKEGRRGYSTTIYEGVDYTYVYDMEYYYNKYPDLQRVIGKNADALIKHFVNNGMREGRIAKSSFNVKFYKNRYPDLQRAFGDNWVSYYLHYINNGYRERRVGAAFTAPGGADVPVDAKGWVTIEGCKYYYKNGSPLTGWQTIDDRKYFFNTAGILKSMTGVDVSRHQGEINWEKVKNDGIEFAIIRVGYGDDLANQDDSTAFYNMQQCKKYNIPYGVYLYSYALTSEQINSEVNHTLRMIKGYNPTMGVFIDMEDASQSSGVSKENLNKFALSYMSQITNAGYKAGVYANKYWLTSIITDNKLNNYIVWIANYGLEGTESPNYSKSYQIWQYSESGSVDGINTRVDMDIYLVP